MKKNYAGYIYIVLTAFIFSTMEVMLKLVHGVFAPMQINALRFLIGGLLLLPFALRSLKKQDLSLSGRDILFFAGNGFLQVCVAMVLYQMAITYTTASKVAVLFSSNALFATLLGGLVLKEQLKKNHFLALAFEIAAILVIVRPWDKDISLTGALLSLASALGFAVYAILGKKKVRRFGSLVSTCLCFILGGTVLLLLLVLGNTDAGASFFGSLGLDIFVRIPPIPRIPRSAILPFLYICGINSAAGYLCHMLAMEKTSVKEASLVFFLKPMIAPVIAWIILKEEIGGNMLLGILLFLIGSGISVLPGIIEERRKQKEA